MKLTSLLGVMSVMAIMAVSLAYPTLVSAQSGGLVTCSGPDCNFCELVKTANNVINLFFELLIIGAIIMVVVAGLKLVVSAGNVSAMQQAKDMMTNIIIGFVIVMSAWLIVDTVMKMLVAKDAGFGVWNQIDNASCGGIKGGSEVYDDPNTGTAF